MGLQTNSLAILATSALFAQHAHAVTSVVRQGQDFVVQGTTTRFNIIGVEYASLSPLKRYTRFSLTRDQLPARRAVGI